MVTGGSWGEEAERRNPQWCRGGDVHLPEQTLRGSRRAGRHYYQTVDDLLVTGRQTCSRGGRSDSWSQEDSTERMTSSNVLGEHVGGSDGKGSHRQEVAGFSPG